MNITRQGQKLIHKYEQFRNHPYIDAVGVATIGWGNTFWEDGRNVSMNDEPISRKRGNRLHAYWLNIFEDAIEKHVSVCLYQCQFDALVSFAYNVGIANFRSSTLLKRINKDPNDPDIANQFKRWNKGRVNGKLTVLRGLTRRRNEEVFLYFSCKRK